MKCLVTKLKESVVNDSLLKLGELMLRFDKTAEDDNNRYIAVASTADIIMTIKGDAYFIDSLTSKNIGKETKIVGNTGSAKLLVSNEKCEVHINNKYPLTVLQMNNPGISGDLSFVSGMNKMSTLTLGASNITGNLSNLTAVKGLINLNILSEKTTGDLSALAHLTEMKNLNIECSNITGNLEDLSSLKKLEDFKLKKAPVEGDVSSLPESVAFFSTQKGTSVLSWKGERSSNTKIIALESVRLGDDIDRMLINQSKCIAAPLGDDVWYSKIEVYGNRTSASDEAVQTLKNKGYTVRVNDVTL